METIVKDYTEILALHHLKYRPVDFYYQVGEIEKVQGWIIHLSARWPQIPDLLTTILPILISQNIPFKVVQNKQKANLLCDGSLGYHQVGKVFCLYPPDDAISLALVKELLEITKDFKGCAVPTDFHLGGIVHTRYGSFKPQLVLDQNGRVERYIHDVNGQLIKDEYHTPFKFPKGVHWPFQEIAAPVSEVPTTFLKDRYKVFSTLKTDAKGRVMKSLRLNGFQVQWVVIKEAKHNVCVDQHGRDIRDRLSQQYILQNDLKEKVPVPEVYDFFKENGNSYLVMEYIKGKPLGQVIEGIYQSSAWFDLHLDKKLQLIDHLLALIDIISKLHQVGYVHRDINWVNFLVNRNKKIVAIDLELAYALNENNSQPPFTYGTPGFMSPEQLKIETPEPNQDIYSLGALMIRFFTNLNPIKFGIHPGLPDDLNFFIRNIEISRLISACLSSKPNDRPEIYAIKSTLKDFRLILSNSEQSSADLGRPPTDRQHIHEVIQCLINTLANPVMVKPGYIWHSHAVQDNELLANLQSGVSYYPGLYAGVGGVMYMLAKAKRAGYNVEIAREVYVRSWEYLHENFLNALPNMVPGFYHGAAGVALSIAKGIEAGLIDPEYQNSIEKCLELTVDSFSIAHGAAGQGLAALHCSILDPKSAQRILRKCVELLLENQQKDGAWLTVPLAGGRSLRYTGFSQGVAGICYFLLRYYDHYQDDRVPDAVSKALHFLLKRAKKGKKGTYWYVSDRKKIFDPWLNDGIAGVALCLIAAYKILDDPAYKNIAESALRFNPEYVVFPDFSFAQGLTGLAHTYLTAAKVFESEEWQSRADFILHTLIHASQGDKKELYYWIIDDNKPPTADFMIGNTGILHFLLHYLSPETTHS